MGEEKEPKPKKAFEVKVIIWDDGEVDAELNEYRPNPSGRGAPGKWRVNATDFIRRMEETLGDPEQLTDTIYEAIGGAIASGQATKKFVSDQILASPIKEESKKEEPKKKKASASSSEESSDGMDFSGFDGEEKQ